MNNPIEPWILLTGFQRFGNHTHNPTQQIAHELHNTHTPNHTLIHSLILPVEYSTPLPLIQTTITNRPHTHSAPLPHAILLTGLAANIPHPKLETQAHPPTQHQHTPPPSPYPTPLPPLHTNINTTKLHEHLTTPTPHNPNPTPINISTNAGTFVCNHLYYLTLQTFAHRTPPNIPVIFLHIPQHNTDANKHIIQHTLNYLGTKLPPPKK